MLPYADEPAPTARRLETRNRLLDGAVAVFTEDGLLGASVEAICTQAGFSRGAFYSNFSSKEELFLALFDRELQRRTDNLQATAERLAPSLQGGSPLSSTATAQYVADFFAPSADSATWFVLETEFLLLALREPSLARGHLELMQRFTDRTADMVAQILAAAGRRFVIPAAHAISAISGVYERVLRDAALAVGPTNTSVQTDTATDTATELGGRIAELLFAITEAITAPLSAAPSSDRAAPSSNR